MLITNVELNINRYLTKIYILLTLYLNVYIIVLTLKNYSS